MGIEQNTVVWAVTMHNVDIYSDKHREVNQLDATECFIALTICSTCFGHLYAHHQELETILVYMHPG